MTKFLVVKDRLGWSSVTLTGWSLATCKEEYFLHNEIHVWQFWLGNEACSPKRGWFKEGTAVDTKLLSFSFFIILRPSGKNIQAVIHFLPPKTKCSTTSRICTTPAAQPIRSLYFSCVCNEDNWIQAMYASTGFSLWRICHTLMGFLLPQVKAGSQYNCLWNDGNGLPATEKSLMKSTSWSHQEVQQHFLILSLAFFYLPRCLPTDLCSFSHSLEFNWLACVEFCRIHGL